MIYERDLKDFSFTFIKLPKFTQKPEDPLNNIKLVDHSTLKEACQALDQHHWSKAEYLAYKPEFKRI